MLGRVALQPQEGTETARVVIAQHLPALQQEVDMIMLAWKGYRRSEDSQTTRHAEMDEQGPLAEPDQQVFAAALDRVDLLTAQDRIEIGGHRPAQSRLADLDRADTPSAKVRQDAAPGGFDFGQFGHGCTQPRGRGAADGRTQTKNPAV